MNIIDVAKLLKDGKYITHDKWRDKESEKIKYNYYIRYYPEYDYMELIDTWRIWSLDNKYAITDYEFSIDDILDDNWVVWSYDEM